MSFPGGHLRVTVNHLLWTLFFISFLFSLFWPDWRMRPIFRRLRRLLQWRDYWLLPVLVLAGITLVVLQYGGASVHGWVLGWYSLNLIVLGWIDFRTTYLPTVLCVPLIWVGWLVSAMNVGQINIGESLIFSIYGFLVFWILGTAYQLIADQVGLGGGDALLLAAIGAWQGDLIGHVMVMSVIITVAWSLLSPDKTYMRTRLIPLGPGLSSAAFLLLIW